MHSQKPHEKKVNTIELSIWGFFIILIAKIYNHFNISENTPKPNALSCHTNFTF